MGRMAKTAHPNSAWFLSQHCCEPTLWQSESFLTWASAFLASVTSHSSILLWCPDSRALLSTGPYLSWLQFIMTFWNHPNVAPPKDLVNNHWSSRHWDSIYCNMSMLCTVCNKEVSNIQVSCARAAGSMSIWSKQHRALIVLVYDGRFSQIPLCFEEVPLPQDCWYVVCMATISALVDVFNFCLLKDRLSSPIRMSWMNQNDCACHCVLQMIHQWTSDSDQDVLHPWWV